MAVMTTTLREIISPNGGGQRAYALPNHTAIQQEVIFQRSKAAVGSAGVAEDSLSFVKQTTDADGNTLANKVVITVSVRRPVNGQAADVDALLAYSRDVWASDEVTSMVASQFPLKA
jgi:hypothetical protein